jgi:hypothetical protein
MVYHTGRNESTIRWSHFLVYIHILKALIVEIGNYL